MVIPIRSFTLGKQRLSGTLEPEHRSRLGAALAGHVLEHVVSAGLRPLVVTADGEVQSWAGDHGHRVVDDPGGGLDAAAAAGIEAALDLGAAWIVLHSDLPLLDAADLHALHSPLDEGQTVIAPSSDGGTSAIGGHREMTFRFGPGSFHRHLPKLDEPTIVVRPGLLLDLDSPGDLFAAVDAAEGGWLREVVPPSLLAPTTRNLY